MIPKPILTVSSVVVFMICLSTAPVYADGSDQSLPGPLGVFFALHMEAGSYDPGLVYQAHFWPRLVQVIAIADRHQAKLTLMFNPKWAEYILLDVDRTLMVKDWQQNGHEVALHYHMVTHLDWCGYTNRQDSVYTDSHHYRGSVEDMMVLIRQLADPEPVLTACNGLDITTETIPQCHPVAPCFIDETDFPVDIIYDVDGIRDGRIRPIAFEFGSRTRYHLRHAKAILQQDIDMRLHEIKTAEPDEIIGMVTHASDYDPKLVDALFLHLGQKGIQVRSVRTIMEEFHQN